MSLIPCLWVQYWRLKINHWHLGCYLSTQIVVYLETIHARCQWKAWSMFGNCLISVPALRCFYEMLFLINRGSTHWLIYLEVSKKGSLLWVIGEPLMMGQNLVMCKEKCLPVVVVRRIVESTFVLIPCLLVFVRNPTVHYAYVSGPTLCHLYPFFVYDTHPCKACSCYRTIPWIAACPPCIEVHCRHQLQTANPDSLPHIKYGHYEHIQW